MKILKHIKILLVVGFAFIGINSAIASAPSIKVSLDSAYLLMGKTTPLHVELVNDASTSGQLLIPKDSVCDKVEVLRILDADTSDLGSGRQEIVLIQSNMLKAVKQFPRISRCLRCCR